MKVYVFADCSNLYYTAIKKWGRKVDYRAVSRYLADFGTIVSKRAYGSQIGSEAQGFITALESDGWGAIFKSPKTYSDGAGGIKRKADWDVPVALDMLSVADPDVSIILLSADGDMSAAVLACQERGARVIILGCGLSGELVRVADSAIEIPPSLLES